PSPNFSPAVAAGAGPRCLRHWRPGSPCSRSSAPEPLPSTSAPTSPVSSAAWSWASPRRIRISATPPHVTPTNAAAGRVLHKSPPAPPQERRRPERPLSPSFHPPPVLLASGTPARHFEPESLATAQLCLPSPVRQFIDGSDALP